jgi:hypothetical protein
MVPMFEVVVLVICAVPGLRWLRRTSLYRYHRSHGFTPGEHGNMVSFGMYQLPRPTPPPAALHGYERPPRRRRFARWLAPRRD